MSPGSHCWSNYILFLSCHLVNSLQLISLQWRHNGHDGVSNHQPHNCLLNRLFRRRSQKTSKLRVTDLCTGNSPVNSPHKWPVTRKMFPLDDVILWRSGNLRMSDLQLCSVRHNIKCMLYIFILSSFIWFQELYNVPYEHIDWSRQRNNVSWADLYSPHSWLLDLGYCECPYSNTTWASPQIISNSTVCPTAF